MIKKLCNECGKVVWHNTGTKSKESQGVVRCTYCGFPLGTGPKKDKMTAIHLQQVAKARAGRP